MLAATHAAFAILCALIIDTIANIPNPLVFYILVLFGALLPDIDHSGSTINKILPITKHLSMHFSHR